LSQARLSFVDRAMMIVIAKLSSKSSPVAYQAPPLTRRAVSEFRRLLGAGAQ
jgi:hypothetical protein